MSEPHLFLRRQPRESLAAKIIFFVFLSTFVTALAVSWISVHSTYLFLRRQIDVRFPAVLGLSSERLASWIDESRETLSGLAADPAVGAAVSEAAPAEKQLTGQGTLETQLERGRRFFDALVLLDSERRVRASAGLENESLQLVELELAHVPAPGVSVVDRPAERPALVAAARVEPRGAGAPGTLYAFYDPERLRAALRSDLLEGDADLYLVDEDGRVVLGVRSGTLPPARAFRLETIASAGGDPPVGEILPESGPRSLASRLRVDGFPLCLVAVQPFRSAFAPIFSLVTRVFVTDLAILLLFSLLAYQVMAAIVRPLEELARGARRVSQGDLDVEVPAPHTRDEIGLLIRTFNDMTRRLRRDQSELAEKQRRLEEQNDELQRANEVLEQLSITDGLTKLHNHRYFQDHLTREIKRVGRTHEPLSMLFIDIDDFKALNDRLGHAAGDELLVHIARILNRSVRESDLLARYGGEEFVVVATGTDLAGAVNLAEKIRTAVAEESFVLENSLRPVRVTVSIGVAQYAGNRKEFFLAADRALYRAKAEGKNCVVAAEDGL